MQLSLNGVRLTCRQALQPSRGAAATPAARQAPGKLAEASLAAPCSHLKLPPAADLD